MLQLATFNDFGEGTMFEPTVETGFTYLHELQVFTGAKDPMTHQALDESDLQLIYDCIWREKSTAATPRRKRCSARWSDDLAAMQIDAARTLLHQASPAGDYNGDGLVNTSDYNTWRNAFGKSTIIYGSGADGDYNGSVDLGDYLVWRKGFVASGAGRQFCRSPGAWLALPRGICCGFVMLLRP